ncbi:SpoIIE family protein phosphatase [Sanguibacter suaedae]|uniref:SpoIIE family protein phosphatase n=1 Tax=Sanguibacter suaedae TaxID=2795737 RepID=A0A934I5D9_9MICO|nr:SpoIIE family protein phosphatase [Sanguibacter suaedae]MBI9115909.1 SpoIIE family protein phosphatase [Sanguibacter suaedae]
MTPPPDAPGTLLSPGEPVDLDNCAREPIHVPGRIQPRGCLLAVRLDDWVVVQCSENVEQHLGLPPASVLGNPLSAALGADNADALARHVRIASTLHDRNPLVLTVGPEDRRSVVDAILHRAPGPDSILVVELEAVDGPRPLTFANTYQAVRDAVAELNTASSLQAVVDVAARRVRELTGFDRVMIYRFDADYNGEVIAEAKQADLNSFHGLHYPASDIPAQARSLYEKNWIRLIADVGYVPSLVVPTDNPVSGSPLDLTFSTLRSVSPIHVEYLQNMGVRASMSISLLREGKLWGLIACHHYSGPHEPPYTVRAAAEFLGSTLSLRLVAQVEEDRIAESRRAARLLADLVARSRDEDRPLTESLTATRSLLDLVRADGVLVSAEGAVATAGAVPDEETCRATARWAAAQGDEVVVTDALRLAAPDLDVSPEAAGVLAAVLPGDEVVVWFRHEASRDVDWGGDPHNKAIAHREGDTVRLSPRRSFDRWREVVRDHSAPWDDEVVEAATTLRSHLVEALYLRGRRDLRAAEAMQRSMLPASLPTLDGWSLSARYLPADGGRVGGDWYDALLLPDGRLAVIVGDVAGHGLEAAASMGQLRNALRALIVQEGSPSGALTALDAIVRWTLPDQHATVLVAVVDLSTGDVEYASAGHLSPLLLGPGGTSAWPDPLGSPPLGVVSVPTASRHATISAGGGIALFSDGLVERRTESIDVGVQRLQRSLAGRGGLDAAMGAAQEVDAFDDATLLLLCRDE